MTFADNQQQMLLEHLRQAGGKPVTFAQLRASGIVFPAVVVSELVLEGYLIDRVFDRGTTGRRAAAQARTLRASCRTRALPPAVAASVSRRAPSASPSALAQALGSA
ncbi:MAG: hypothetical protein ACYDHH_20085 [Solirubrobacteraceae bacterium]